MKQVEPLRCLAACALVVAVAACARGPTAFELPIHGWRDGRSSDTVEIVPGKTGSYRVSLEMDARAGEPRQTDCLLGVVSGMDCEDVAPASLDVVLTDESGAPALVTYRFEGGRREVGPHINMRSLYMVELKRGVRYTVTAKTGDASGSLVARSARYAIATDF